MTAGMPQDMRRPVMISVAVHAFVLVLAVVVPLMRFQPQGSSAIQVMLVSKAAAPVPRIQVEQRPPTPLPAPVPVPAKVLEPQPQPKPAQPAPAAVPRPVQKVVQAETPKPIAKAPEAPPDVKEALRRAEETLTKSSKAVAPPASSKPASRAAEDISKLLGQLPTTPVPSQEAHPAVALAPQGSTALPRPALLERCPPIARAYCPLLEAAINRVWSADTDPALRRILESAGNSTATVQIVIQPDGEIRSVRLDKSSGNDAYDRAVQSLLAELRRVPPLPDDMKGEPFVAITSFTYMKKKES